MPLILFMIVVAFSGRSTSTPHFNRIMLLGELALDEVCEPALCLGGLVDCPCELAVVGDDVDHFLAAEIVSARNADEHFIKFFRCVRVSLHSIIFENTGGRKCTRLTAV